MNKAKTALNEGLGLSLGDAVGAGRFSNPAFDASALDDGPADRLLADRAAGALRPAVEAMLLAAVALGVAQTGWGVLAPGAAGASDAADPGFRDLSGAAVIRPTAAPAEARSPFAPQAGSVPAQSHAAQAAMSGLSVAGVRIALDPARSSAVLALADGGQRAVRVGQEISGGVRLAEVRPDYVLLTFDGGQQRLPAPAPVSAGGSYARALMGRAPVPADARPTPAAPAAAPAPAPLAAAAAAETTPFAARAPAVLQAPRPAPAAAPEAPTPLAVARAPSLAPVAAPPSAAVTGAVGQGAGLRVPTPAPAEAQALGLAAGDLVTAVNGAAPGDPAALAQAAATGRVTLTVRRGEGAEFTVTVPLAVLAPLATSAPAPVTPAPATASPAGDAPAVGGVGGPA